MWASGNMQEEQPTILENDVGQSEEVHFEKETRCGIWTCYPSFLQPLASKKTYVVIFGLLGMADHARGSYMVATLSTLEKRFKLTSRTSGLISCSFDIGSLLSSISMSYIGGRGHKTRWIALGTTVSCIASFAQLLPHFIYGAGDDIKAVLIYGNQTATETINSLSMCGLGSLQEEDCSEGSQTAMPGYILMMSNLVMGAGSCMYWTLGVAYLDDNAKKNKVAWLLSISVFLRMLGPILGNFLASYALDMYVDPSLTVKITSSDPRWIGAWWFGWIIYGFVTLIFAFAFALFPRQLPRTAEREKLTLSKIEDTTEKSIRDFCRAVLRLMKNRILMYNVISSVFYMFGLMAYYTFLPKYIEMQFRLTASEASFFTGSVALVCTALGVIVSGAFISKYKPRPRVLAAWNVFVEILDVVGGISFSFISCQKEALHGSWNNDGTWNLFNDCNSNCNCGPDVKYEPVCSLDKTTTFYSPCHAGCTNASVINGTKLFTNCSCIPNSEMATESYCPVDCKNDFLIFLAVLGVVHFFGATGRAGNTIIQFRSVSPKDKSIAIGFTEMLLCALAFIPAPIFYGALLDHTCLVWGYTCEETGNCWLYNDQLLRYFLNLTLSGFLLIAVLMDCGVWYHVKGLQIYDEEVVNSQKNNTEEKDQHSFSKLLKSVINSSNVDS